MFARITPYKMKPGPRDEILALLEKLKDRVMALDGMRQFINVMDDDGKGYVIALTENAEMTPELAEKVKGIWAEFGAYMDAPPSPPESYNVVADWDQ